MNPPVFEPIRTPRLLIRQARPEDADALYQRRNDPLVARYQDWATPYPMAKVEEVLAEIALMQGPEPDQWWMATVEEVDSDEVIGDLVVHQTSGGHTAEIGYTFASGWWGKGLAVEAVQGLVDRLFAGGKFDAVFHLAARAGVRPSLAEPILYEDVNCIGTLRLLEAARRHGPGLFLFGSPITTLLFGQVDSEAAVIILEDLLSRRNIII